jgi:hypothetical protein
MMEEVVSVIYLPSDPSNSDLVERFGGGCNNSISFLDYFFGLDKSEGVWL